jgi:hypothetical protein
MNLFEMLPKEDVRLMKTYLDWYGDHDGERPAMPLEDMNYFLRFWSEEKINLFHMLGNQLIVKREMVFNKSLEELAREVDQKMIYNCCGPAETFRRNYIDYINNHFDEWEMRDLLWRFVDHSYDIADNRYTYRSFVVPASATVNGREIQVSEGCKLIKMLGKLAEAFGITEGYEEYRQLHSQILNQKKIKGTLCLSIHPMDYITMSDNNCGWQSCMQWMDEAGDYRLGTIEMMNSPCVVVAYLEADEPMYICTNGTWNNKKWRQLYIVNRDIILGNRQYPYVNPEIQGQVINWLRDLAMADPNYGPYEETTTNIRNKEHNIICGGRDVYFDIYTSIMYNDVYDDRLAYLNPNIAGNSSHYDLNFSGEAVCTGCGDIIEPGDVEPYIVRCNSCDGSWRCSHCGDRHYGDNYYEVNGNYYCDWCYHNELDQCETCGEVLEDANRVMIYLPRNENDKTNYLADRYYVSLCDYCFDHPEAYEAEFGPMIKFPSYYGGYEKYGFLLKNITDRGLEMGNLTPYNIDRLRRLRDCESPRDYHLIWNPYN